MFHWKNVTSLLWVLPIAFCAVTILTSCSDAESDAEGGTREEQAAKTSSIPDEARTLVSVMKNESYTPDEFLKHLGSPSMRAITENIQQYPTFVKINNLASAFAKMKLNAHLPYLDSLFAAEVGTENDGTRRWRFESYTFTYKSVTSYGQSMEMSGRVTFPNNIVESKGHEVSTLSLHSHQELPDADCAPSENLMFMSMRAMYNSAVIEPDFQNLGINYTKVFDGTGSAKALTRQLVDCVIAALEVMHQHGVTLDPEGYTTNWGSSKNVAVPIGFAKYYETEAPQWFRDAIRLESTFTGEGEIDLGNVMPFYYQHPEFYPVIYYYTGCYLAGLTAKQLGGYEPKELLAPWFTNTIYHIGDKDYTALEALSLGLIKNGDPRLPEITRLDQILASDLLTPDGLMDESNPKGQAFLRGMSEESGVYGWEPTLPIYIAHCPYDEVIPYSCSREFYLQFSNQETNPAVRWVDVPYPESLVEAANQDGISTLHVLVSFFMHLYMSCIKDPVDLAKMYDKRIEE